MRLNFFNQIHVEERDNIIYVLNVSGEIIKHLIDTTWRHPQLGKYIFTYSGKSFFSFNSFFAPDVVYMIDILLLRNEYGWKTTQVLTTIKDLIYQKTWMAQTLKTYPSLVDLSFLREFKLTPYAKQKSFFASLDKTLSRFSTRGYLLAGVPGSGKTYVGLATSLCLNPTTEYRPTIIISPNPAKELVWGKSIRETLFKRPRKVWVYNTGQDLVNGYDYYVFTPESADEALVLGRIFTKHDIPFFVIVDESQRFNEMTAIRTHRIIELCTLCPSQYFLWLSGSPIKKLGSEMIPFLKAADQKRFDKDTEMRFKRIWGVSAGLASEIFHHRFGEEIAFVISDTDVKKGKPDYKDIPIKLPDAEAKVFLISSIREEMRDYMEKRLMLYESELSRYELIIKKSFSDYEDTLTTDDQKAEWNLYKDRYNRDKYDEPNVTTYVKTWCRNYERQNILPTLSASLRVAFPEARSITKTMLARVRGEALGKVVAKRRSECAYLLGKHADLPAIVSGAKAKTLIYASNVLPLEKTRDDFIKDGYHALFMTNAAEIAQFKTTREINPGLATFSFLSESVPLIEANTLIMLNPPFRQAVWEQTVARVLRIGQTNQVVIRGLLLDTGTEPNISTRGSDIINSCRADLRGLIGEDFSGPVTPVVDPLMDKTARDDVQESLL